MDNEVVKQRTTRRKPTFVDVFAGCGGLSLGLLQAGFKGIIAVEKDEHAFATLETNLLGSNAHHRFSWPSWLPKSALSVEQLVSDYSEQLGLLSGTVDVLVGGPPCQGFSCAGRRRQDDPRNQMFKHYLKVIEILQPRVILLENVRGFKADFPDENQPIRNYAAAFKEILSKQYSLDEEMLDLSVFGLPQARTRYFLVASLPGVLQSNPFFELKKQRPAYLRKLGLSGSVSAWAALSDLEVSKGGTTPSVDTRGFRDIRPSRPLTRYQKLMRAGVAVPSDLRLAKHSDRVAARFSELIQLSHEQGRSGRAVGSNLRAQFGLRKTALRVLDPDLPAPTITSMPDDLLHYAEPRTLSVRENARLQSFPDWFTFKGKYTSGGLRRRTEVPRFTQVANAVPPLVARAFGETLAAMLKQRATRS